MEEEMATHSSILAWKIPWIEELGVLQSMGSQRVGHDCVTEHTQCTHPCTWCFFPLLLWCAESLELGLLGGIVWRRISSHCIRLWGNSSLYRAEKFWSTNFCELFLLFSMHWFFTLKRFFFLICLFNKIRKFSDQPYILLAYRKFMYLQKQKHCALSQANRCKNSSLQMDKQNWLTP